MTLEKELKALRRERREAIADLHRTYVRTRQQIRRKASPDRFIRRHIGATIGVAALAGLLLAPRPTRRPEKPLREPRESIATHFRRLFKHALARVDRMVQPAADEKKKEASGHMASLIASLVPMLLGKLNLPQLVSQFMGRRPATHNGHHPDISVANAGTVNPDDQ